MRMTKQSMLSKGRKLLSAVLSSAMLLGSFTGTAFAEEPAAAAAETEPELVCRTASLEIENDGTSIRQELFLTLPKERIKTRINREDVSLGGAFRNMRVASLKHDKRSIVLTLAGVPDFTEESATLPLMGTLTLPGELVGADGSITGSVRVLEKKAEAKEPEPTFYPYLDAMMDDGEAFRLQVTLLPMSGTFAEDLSADDVSFDLDLTGAEVTAFDRDEDGCALLEITVPKQEAAEGEAEESVYADTLMGAVILGEGSMLSTSGEAFPEECIFVRGFSAVSVGRDLSEGDVKKIKGIVGGFGNTTAGTVIDTISGVASAVSAGYAILSFCGVFPSDASRHAEIMEQLSMIREELHDVSEEVHYMSDVLDQHTKMLNHMGVKLDQQYLAGFNTDFNRMVSDMNMIEKKLPSYKDEIDAILAETAEKYALRQQGTGRDFDEAEVEFDDLSEYYEAVPDDFYYEEEVYEEDLTGEGDVYEEDLYAEDFVDEGDVYEEEANEDVFVAEDDALDADPDLIGEEGVEAPEEVEAGEEEGLDEDILMSEEEAAPAEDLQYVIESDEVSLADLLAAVGLSGDVEAVSVSDENAILVSEGREHGEWILSWPELIGDEQQVFVTIDGTEYVISIMDPRLAVEGTILGGEQESQSAFMQSQVVGDVEVTVRAEAGAFPADAVLSVEEVSGELGESALAAVDEVRGEGLAAAASLTFDIKVLDASGNELQPADGDIATVSFTPLSDIGEGVALTVYRIDDDAMTAAKLESGADEQAGSIVVFADYFSLYTLELTTEKEEEEAEAFDNGPVLDHDELENYLIDVDKAIGRLDATANRTIGDLLNEIASSYDNVITKVTNADNSNPIVTFINIHEGTDNFATSSVLEKLYYEETIRYQLYRALNMLDALDSPTLYEERRAQLDAVDWVDVEENTKDRNGNPYCYLMEGYVRLATFDELDNFILPVKNHGSEKEIFVKSASGLKVDGQEFAKRMHGRTLQEELETAGIANLTETRNAQHLYENNYTEYKKFGGIMFGLERWSNKRSKKWFAVNSWTDDLKYSINGGNPSGLDWLGDGQYHAGAWITAEMSYVLAAPDYIEWDSGSVGAPPANVYEGDDKYDVFKYQYPMTYFVRVGK